MNQGGLNQHLHCAMHAGAGQSADPPARGGRSACDVWGTLGPMAGSANHTALYAGSFDPITFGHLDVIGRGRRIFDRLVVGVGRNPDKQTLFSGDERMDMVRRLVDDMAPDDGAAPVDVLEYHSLTVDFAREIGATVLLRGIRNLADLQDEVQQAVTNREVGGLETVFIVAGQSFAYTSSTLIRQITAMGDDLSVLASLCPPPVIEALRAKKRENPAILQRLQAEP